MANPAERFAQHVDTIAEFGEACQEAFTRLKDDCADLLSDCAHGALVSLTPEAQKVYVAQFIDKRTQRFAATLDTFASLTRSLNGDVFKSEKRILHLCEELVRQNDQVQHLSTERDTLRRQCISLLNEKNVFIQRIESLTILNRALNGVVEMRATEIEALRESRERVEREASLVTRLQQFLRVITEVATNFENDVDVSDVLRNLVSGTNPPSGPAGPLCDLEQAWREGQGSSANSAAAQPEVAAAHTPTCVICLDRPACVVFEPCRHLVCCATCCSEYTHVNVSTLIANLSHCVAMADKNCPRCRKHIESLLYIYI